MSHHFREMKVGDYMSVKGPKVYGIPVPHCILYVDSACSMSELNTLYMLHLVLCHDTYFGIDFYFVYNPPSY